MFPETLLSLARTVLDGFRLHGLRLTLAESCTGGLITGCLTALEGASTVIECGFIPYSNEAKTGLLGVPENLLWAHGAVSAEVARAMAEGALAHSRASVAMAVTGIAGPGGGSPQKPVGLVFLATARHGEGTRVERHVFPGNREQVRLATTMRALGMLLARLPA